MRKLRDFKCSECGKIQERLVNDDVHKVLCNNCPSMADKMLSAPAGNGNAAHGFMRAARSK